MANTTTTVVNSQLTVSEIPAQYFGVKISPQRIGKKQVVLSFKDGGCFASLGTLQGIHKSGYPEPSDEEEAKQSWSKDLYRNGPSQAQARRTHWLPCSYCAATDCFPYFAGEEMGTEQVW